MKKTTHKKNRNNDSDGDISSVKIFAQIGAKLNIK